MWRQGDILFQRVEAIPADLEQAKVLVLDRSSNTGHRHAVRDRSSARLFRSHRVGEMYLQVTADHAEVIHPEHDTIVLGNGNYRVWKQRELTDFGARNVLD